MIEIETTPGWRHPKMAYIAAVCHVEHPLRGKPPRQEGHRWRLSFQQTPTGWEHVGVLPRGARLHVLLSHRQPLNAVVQGCRLGAGPKDAWRAWGIESDSYFHPIEGA